MLKNRLSDVSLLISGLLLCAISVSAQQAAVPVEYSIFRHPSPGYFLFAPNTTDTIGFFDHGAKLIHTFPQKQVVNFDWQKNNTVTYYTDEQKFYVRNSAIGVTGTLRMPDFVTDFHECLVLANGNTVLFGRDTRTVDMSRYVAGGKTNAAVTGAVIREYRPDNTIVFEWNSFDHTEITHATEDIDLTQQSIDYMHPNSIVESADGNFLLSCRHFDAVLKIDRVSGDILWWLGGKKARKNDFRIIGDDVNGFTGFSHQHSVKLMTNGDLMMFDNGNLKPTRFSRVVMYSLNEAQWTATRTWEYRHTPDVYAASMGSTQELENGNILIGWGGNTSRLVATELGLDKIVQAELISPFGSTVQSYKVVKAPFSMTGVQSQLSTTGKHEFRRVDSTTHLTIDISTLSRSTNVVVERHWNTLSAVQFEDDEPCLILPARWSVRANSVGTISATMSFAVSAVPGIEAPNLVAMYHRPVEGVGKFSAVAGVYNGTTGSYTVNSFETGEYIAVYVNCLIPALISPKNTQTQVPIQVLLSWSPSVQTAGYQVQVSTSATFNQTFINQIDNDETFMATNLSSYTTYYWRVRGRSVNGPGAWSTVWSFKTSLGVPGIIAPRIDFDTVSVSTRPTLTWSTVNNATAYHVRLYHASNMNSVLLSDTVSVTKFTPPLLAGNTMYRWDVRALADTSKSVFSSRASFITSPDQVLLRRPGANDQGLALTDVRLVWSPVSGATSYQVLVGFAGSESPMINRSLTDTTLLLPPLPADTLVWWTVRANGKYGSGEYAVERSFRTLREGMLPSPILMSPENGAEVDRNDVHLRWSVSDATSFVLEVASSDDFENIVFAIGNLNSNEYVLPIDVLVQGSTYFWRIQGKSVDKSSVFSASWSFTVKLPPGPPIVIGLTPLSPESGAINVPLQGKLRWSQDSRMDAYRAVITETKNGVEVLDELTTDTTLLYSDLKHGTEYSWRVVGRHRQVNVDTGAAATFKTLPAVIASVGELVTDASGLLKAMVDCGDDAVEITVVDIAGRLLDKTTVVIADGRWTYQTRSPGAVIVCATACGKQWSWLIISR